MKPAAISVSDQLLPLIQSFFRALSRCIVSTRNSIEASDTEIRHRSCQKEQFTPVRRLKPTTWRTYSPLNAQITPCQKFAPHSDISFFVSLWCFYPLSSCLPVSSVKRNLQRQSDTLQDESGIVPYTERTDELGGF